MGFPEDMQGGPQFSRSSVEYTFLRHRIRSDDQDYAKRGDKFVLSLVSEKQRDNFEVALRCLEEIGCRRDVLLKCLFRLWRSKATPAEFPLRKELNCLSATCRTVANSIKRLEGIGVSEALRETVPPPPTLEGEILSAKWSSPHNMSHLEACFGARRERLPVLMAELALNSEEIIGMRIADLLAWDADLIEHWWTPRKDIVRSYGRVVCHLYPGVATSDRIFTLGPLHFDLTTRLVDSFINSTGKGSAEKNVKNFRERFPSISESLIIEMLRTEHLASLYRDRSRSSKPK